MNTPLNKLSNILRILHVPNHFKVSMELLNGSNMNTYQHMYPPTPLIGGAKKTNEIVEYKGAKFVFYYYGDEYSMQYVLHPRDDSATRCLIILVDIVGKHVVLHGVTYDETCFEDHKCKVFANEWNGSTLLKISFILIKQLKAKYELNYIVLTDNSIKYCKAGKQIDLDSFLMLTTGNTWYGKYGFVPYDKVHEITDKLNFRDYKNNKKIVSTILLKNTNIKKIILRKIYKHKLNFSLNEIETTLTKHEEKNRTVMNCLKDLTRQYDRTCEIFYHCYQDIMIDLKMKNLHGIMYWKKL